jgi:hypothetical protein
MTIPNVLDKLWLEYVWRSAFSVGLPFSYPQICEIEAGGLHDIGTKKSDVLDLFVLLSFWKNTSAVYDSDFDKTCLRTLIENISPFYFDSHNNIDEIFACFGEDNEIEKIYAALEKFDVGRVFPLLAVNLWLICQGVGKLYLCDRLCKNNRLSLIEISCCE